ncbi:MAG: hypothetical protein GX628_08310 [Clostridiales bacterium]|nr:hypothetical protein [Clostridiales bacterium]
MKGLVCSLAGDVYSISAAGYMLELDTAKAAARVILDGTAAATLDLRSAVCQLDGENKEIIDREPDIPVFAGCSDSESGLVFTFEGRSSLWLKTYRLVCTPLRFNYYVTVKGKGRVDSVNYFSGDPGGDKPGSGYEFAEGFNPCVSWYNTEDYYFRSSVSCHRWSVLTVPPMFCYSFRCEGLGQRLTLGLAAERGEHNFQSFDYRAFIKGWHTGFCLATDQHGHTSVDGEWTAPHIIGFGAEDEFDSMRKYCDYYFASGIADPSVNLTAPTPRFWHGPMLCGWIEQIMQGAKAGKSPPELARQDFYEGLVEKAHGFGLEPRVLIIDDKWQSEYATDHPDPAKWDDLRGFIDRRHAENCAVLLWFKLWDPEGWPEELCIVSDKGERRIDPSQPAFIAELDRILHRLLSDEPGRMNCDGFKLDFAFWNPIGRGFKTYSGRYGVELMYDMMKHIYDKAKEIKPYALINCSPCHPYFASICDQARLHDYNYNNRSNLEDLKMRAKLFAIANPGTLIDTDNAGFNTRRDSMRWLLNQPLTGVPDLYSLTPSESMPDMTDDDFYAIARVWREYSAKIDALYGGGKSFK